MTLTLDIPSDLDAAKRERLAVTLYDTYLISQGKAAQVAGLSRAAFIDILGKYQVTPFQYDGPDDLWGDLETLAEGDSKTSEVIQGSPEWNARLHSTFRAAASLTDEQTRRESLYGDDLR